jgi:hypothetical protein
MGVLCVHRLPLTRSCSGVFGAFSCAASVSKLKMIFNHGKNVVLLNT